MPIYNIKQSQPWVNGDEISLMSDVITRKWLAEGCYADMFRNRVKELTGSKHAVLAPNGTLGLFLALLALDLPKDSEVIIPSFTFFASASSVVFAGLRPVFVDVEEGTFNIDVGQLERAITSKTRAIMPVHIYGNPCKMSQIMEIAEKHGLVVIEDAAQALGCFYKQKHVGTFGHVSMISFYADKTITTGEGAVVLTGNEKLYNKLVLLRNQGRHSSGTFIHAELGMNFRITDIQCVVGIAQLGKLEEIIRIKTEHYNLFKNELDNVGDLSFLTVEKESTFVPFRFMLRTDRKNELKTYLEENHIQIRDFFCPMHLQPPLKKYCDQDLKVSEKLYNTGLCLPIHCNLTKGDILYVADKIRHFFDN